MKIYQRENVYYESFRTRKYFQIYGIYMYLMILSSQQMTKVIAFLSNLLSLVPCEDLLTLLLHLQTKKHLTDKF